MLFRKKLNKLEVQFAEGEKNMNSSKIKMQPRKESNQLIRSLDGKPIRMTKSGHKKLRFFKWKVNVRIIDEECLKLHGLDNKKS